METTSIILSSLSLVATLILGGWSVYLALEIKKKYKYWKKIKNINIYLQDEFSELKDDLKTILKSEKNNKESNFKKINEKDDLEDQIQQNNLNIKILLNSVNEVLLQNIQKINILFNNVISQQLEEIIYFLDKTYATTKSDVSAAYFYKLPLVKKGLNYFINDDYLDKEKDCKNITLPKTIEEQKKKVVNSISIQDIDEYIKKFDNENNLYWTEKIECSSTLINIISQKTTYEIDEKYLLLIYDWIISFVATFNRMEKSREIVNEQWKEYDGCWNQQKQKYKNRLAKVSDLWKYYVSSNWNIEQDNQIEPKEKF